MTQAIVNLIKNILLSSIKLYQLTRCLRNSCCRFYPSCSDYALLAIERRGTLRGLFLSIVRMAKCHPWHPGGVDCLELS